MVAYPPLLFASLMSCCLTFGSAPTYLQKSDMTCRWKPKHLVLRKICAALERDKQEAVGLESHLAVQGDSLAANVVELLLAKGKLSELHERSEGTAIVLVRCLYVDDAGAGASSRRARAFRGHRPRGACRCICT